MSFTANTDFFISKIDGLRDPYKTTRWRVLIPGAIFQNVVTRNGQFKDADGADDFALLVKTCKIPDIGIEYKEINYMGFKSWFPVNAKIDAEMPFEGILYEDMRGYEAMLGWQQAILNTSLLQDGDKKDLTEATAGNGVGLGREKNGNNDKFLLRNNTIKIELYNWMTGLPVMTVHLINASPMKVGGPSLNYANAEIGKFDFTLKCDRWSVEIPTT